MDHRETWLAATLVELLDTFVVVDSDESVYGAALVTHLTELLVGVEIGLIIQDPAGTPRVVAASSERALDVLSAELDLDDGPCVACYRTGERLLNLDIATVADRWPPFVRFATAAGFRAVTALPMRRHGDIAGVAGLFDAIGQPLAESEVKLAQALVEAATVGLRQRRRLLDSARVAEQLQYALDSRVLIEQAKGMAAASLAITPDEAFTLLGDYARRHDMLLSDVAVQVIQRELVASDLRRPAGPASGRVSPDGHAPSAARPPRADLPAASRPVST